MEPLDISNVSFVSPQWADTTTLVALPLHRYNKQWRIPHVSKHTNLVGLYNSSTIKECTMYFNNDDIMQIKPNSAIKLNVLSSNEANITFGTFTWCYALFRVEDKVPIGGFAQA